jgi:RNA polymerase sigma-70 factor, ECF subfamily
VRREGHPETDILLERVAQGDAEALSLLFDKYARLVFSIGLRVLHCEPDAEELVQEVFLQLWSGRAKSCLATDRYSGHERLIRFTYHRAFDRRGALRTRSLLHYPKNSKDAPAKKAKEKNSDLIKYGISRNDGEILLLHEELERLLEQLKPTSREVIELHFYQGYELRDIAESKGWKIVDVRNRFYRALRFMREAMTTVAEALETEEPEEEYGTVLDKA